MDTPVNNDKNTGTVKLGSILKNGAFKMAKAAKIKKVKSSIKKAGKKGLMLLVWVMGLSELL